MAIYTITINYAELIILNLERVSAMNRKKVFSIIAIAVMILSMTGCMDMKVALNINGDNTGGMEVVMAYNEDLMGTEDTAVMTEDFSDMQNYEGMTVKVEPLTYEKDTGTFKGEKIVASFENAYLALKQMSADEGFNFIEKGDGVYRIEMDLETDSDGSGMSTSTPEDAAQAKAFLQASGAEMFYSITTDYTVLYNNATNVDGKVYTWDLIDIMTSEVPLTKAILEYKVPAAVEAGIETVRKELAQQTPVQTATALPTAAKVTVNGAVVEFDAYNINGNNYFKLRDIALALNDSEKPFEVSWDASKNAINLLTNSLYTPVGGELMRGNGLTKPCILTTSKIFKDGSEVNLTAYNISGFNYFKLRDLGAAFNFSVAWDGTSKTIAIDTKSEYMPE